MRTTMISGDGESSWSTRFSTAGEKAEKDHERSAGPTPTVRAASRTISNWSSQVAVTPRKRCLWKSRQQSSRRSTLFTCRPTSSTLHWRRRKSITYTECTAPEIHDLPVSVGSRTLPSICIPKHWSCFYLCRVKLFTPFDQFHCKSVVLFCTSGFLCTVMSRWSTIYIVLKWL